MLEDAIKMDLKVLFFLLASAAIVCSSEENKEKISKPSKEPPKQDPISGQSPDVVKKVEERVEKLPHNGQEKEKLSESSKVPVKSAPISKENDNVVLTKKEAVAKLPPKGHILFFHNMGTRSHLIAMGGLAEGLVQYGHKVTAVFYAKSKLDHENYTEILIEDK